MIKTETANEKKGKTMKITNAIKKLEKSGYIVKANESFGHFTARRESSIKVIEFCRNGRSEELTCIRVRRTNDLDDSMTDYCAGYFCDTITQAIKSAA